MLSSWSPEDPSFLSATDEPAQNILGSFGAYAASPLMMIAGYGSWMLVVAALVWGLRFMLHRGEDRFMRALFTPIAVALASVYCSTLMPVAGWEQTYGLGGHFGDMIMGAMLNLLPVKAQIGIRLAGLVTAVGVLAITAFSLGFERSELQGLWRRFVAGLLTAFDLAMRAVGQGAAALRRRRTRDEPEEGAESAEDSGAFFIYAAAAGQPGYRDRMTARDVRPVGGRFSGRSTTYSGSDPVSATCRARRPTSRTSR